MPASHYCPHCRTPLPEVPASGYCPLCGTPWDTQLAQPPDETRTLSPAAAVTPPHPGAATRTFGPPGSGWRSPPRIPNYGELTYVAGGGMGTVFRAVQHGINRVVAIKLINQAALYDTQARVRFGNEMQALGRVEHPNVVQVHDSGETDDTPFYAMEYLGGGTLAQRLGPRTGGLDLMEAARIIADVAEGVHAAHLKDVLHRDIKPGNILMTEDDTPKIADFGLVKLMDAGFQMTVTGSQLGTPPYMAPEQIRGVLKHITVRSDVYGLGATLYECLTGRPPFRGETREMTQQMVLHTEPKPPSQLRPEIPKDLEAVCLRCLAKDPAQRFPTAQELADELRRWLKGEPTRTQPPTRLQKVGRWAKRHRKAVTAVGVVLFAAFAVLAGVWYFDPKRQIERTLDRRQPVTLVGNTGKPKWHRWVLGEVPLGESNVGDGSWGFETHGLKVLELCSDPRHETYRFSVELRHQKVPSEQSLIGVWIGCSQENEANDVRILRFLGVEFHDRDRVALPNVIPMVYAKDYLIARSDAPVTSTHSQGGFPFTPANRNFDPPWRRIELTVSPAGIAIAWDSDNPKQISHRVLRTKLDKQQLVFQDARAGLPGPPVPAWSPRSPLGVYARDAEIAFRNVVVTPVIDPLTE